MTALQEKLREFDGALPLERARTIPSSWYFDAEIYAAECQRVFGRSWLLACRAEQVREPGAFVTVEMAGEPILVLCDDQGVLRALSNVCRHKAAQVINQPCGKVTKLRCRYHGWTYDLTGRLRGTPEFDGVADFNREENGLPALAVDTWGPLVFVHHGKPQQSLAEFLAPLPERAAGLGLERLKFVARREYDLACNWKVFVDNYQDGGYHVNTVHPGLAGALDYAHYRTENFDHGGVQISPLKPSADPTIAKVRSGDNAYYWWIFPNLMINIYQGVMDTNLVLPLGPDRCKVYFDYYFANFGPETERYVSDSIAVAHQVQIEDMSVCDEVQRGLKSSTYRTGRFSVKRESGCYHFHQVLAQYLRSE
ncbi:MAG TPA: aromatic ring-hydroxylating dioxygenase subunit alpha [Terriglobales bacterium]|nr:aromatic ring-hydroxylating dioxygenase subunit alpha [Terriglobales bacterium]